MTLSMCHLLSGKCQEIQGPFVLPGTFLTIELSLNTILESMTIIGL